MSKKDLDEKIIQEYQSVINFVYDKLDLKEELISKDFISIVLMDILTFDSKQHDYGSSNIATFGEQGVLVRSQDKLSRIKNMIWYKDVEPKNESIDDSWGDGSVYGVIARMCRRGLWPGIQ